MSDAPNGVPADLRAAVDCVFVQLALTYGTPKLEAFCKGQDIATVKRFWCHTLRGVSPVDVLRALEVLPAEFLPNSLQFKALAQKRAMPMFKALRAPEADPQRVRECVAKLRSLAEGMRHPKDPKAWIARLQQRGHLTRYQQQCLDEALGRTVRPDDPE